MYKKILITLDNSPTDQAILAHVRPLARHCGAALVLVHVADGFAARLQDQLNLTDSEEIIQDRSYLEQLTLDLKAEGFDAHQHLLKGDPVTCILDLVAEEQCDLIAMATHGHRFLQDWFFGSVADGLRHKANVPILMVRAHRARSALSERTASRK
jgi:nucleotide-binding universal stress UspA family protein